MIVLTLPGFLIRSSDRGVILFAITFEELFRTQIGKGTYTYTVNFKTITAFHHFPAGLLGGNASDEEKSFFYHVTKLYRVFKRRHVLEHFYNIMLENDLYLKIFP